LLNKLAPIKIILCNVALGRQNNNLAIDVEREGLLGIKQRTTWSKGQTTE
jgi:hypothetical protein